MAISHAVRSGCSAKALYERVLTRANEMQADESLYAAVVGAEEPPRADYISQAGWANIALQNALWQLLNAENLEDAVIDSVMRGGDTDTAIAGALPGAVQGRRAIPDQWEQAVLNCRPEAVRLGVRRARPKRFWPVDALELAERLISSA